MAEPGLRPMRQEAHLLEFLLSLGQRNALRRPAVDHILHLHGSRRNADHFVAPVDDLPLARDKNIFALRKKNPLRLSRLVGEAKKLQRDGRRLRRWRWRPHLRLFYLGVVRRSILDGYRWRLGLRDENISS